MVLHGTPWVLHFTLITQMIIQICSKPCWNPPKITTFQPMLAGLAKTACKRGLQGAQSAFPENKTWGLVFDFWVHLRKKRLL